MDKVGVRRIRSFLKPSMYNYHVVSRYSVWYAYRGAKAVDKGKRRNKLDVIWYVGKSLSDGT